MCVRCGAIRVGGRGCPRVRGRRGEGSGGTMGRHGRGGPRRRAGRDGGREEPRKGPSTLPVRTGCFVALHPTQYTTRLTLGKHITCTIAIGYSSIVCGVSCDVFVHNFVCGCVRRRQVTLHSPRYEKSHHIATSILKADRERRLNAYVRSNLPTGTCIHYCLCKAIYVYPSAHHSHLHWSS